MRGIGATAAGELDVVGLAVQRDLEFVGGVAGAVVGLGRIRGQQGLRFQAACSPFLQKGFADFWEHGVGQHVFVGFRETFDFAAQFVEFVATADRPGGRW